MRGKERFIIINQNTRLSVDTNWKLYVRLCYKYRRDFNYFSDKIWITIPCNSWILSSTSGSRCMNVVAKRTPPPKASRPITSWLEERRLGPLDFVNQSNFKEMRSGRHPTIMDMPKRHTIVMIFAIKASPVFADGSVVKFKFIFVRFFAAHAFRCRSAISDHSTEFPALLHCHYRGRALDITIL